MLLKELKDKIVWAHEESSKGNVNAFDEVYAPNILLHLPPLPDVRGLEANKQVSAAVHKAFTDFHMESEEAISEGNTVAHRYTIRMKHTGVYPMVPVPATEKELVMKGCAVYHVKNDKIVEIFEYHDLLGLLQQIGVVPPMGQQ